MLIQERDSPPLLASLTLQHICLWVMYCGCGIRRTWGTYIWNNSTSRSIFSWWLRISESQFWHLFYYSTIKHIIDLYTMHLHALRLLIYEVTAFERKYLFLETFWPVFHHQWPVKPIYSLETIHYRYVCNLSALTTHKWS